MKTFALIHGDRVAEVITPFFDSEGNEVPIEERFHPDFVASLIDVSDTPEVAQGWLYDGRTVTPPAPVIPAPAELKAACVNAIQEKLDAVAQAKGYDNILSACSYAAQPEGAPFRDEGAAFLSWRSDVWQRAYAMLAEVDAGKADMPTPEQAVAAMPTLSLPA